MYIDIVHILNIHRRMIKNIMGGLAVGIANIIPGVSGGTMLVILGIFDRLVESISEIFKIKSKNRKEALVFLLQVLIGAVIGIVGFAKVIDWLFNNYSTQTFYWFIGLVFFSIPTFLKSELKGNKISWIYLGLGLLIIFAIEFFSPEKEELIIVDFPAITLVYLLGLVIVGMIAGATMLFPGISGSLVLLIIGKYYIFKSYVANVTTFKMDVLIPLCFIALGIALGVLLSAKGTHYLLNYYRKQTVSLILGLIIASVIILIPINITYNLMTILSSIVAFICGAVIVYLVDHFV